MRSETSLIVGSDLRNKAKQQTIKLLGLASRHLSIKLEEPTVRFDLRGKTAGQVRFSGGQTCVIRYNVSLMQRYPTEFLARTVPHETAHVVAFNLHGSRIQPHGREWQTIMSLFGAPPERCHSYDVEGQQTRRLRRYEYRCGCRSHQLTSIRHNRIRAGQVYLCRQCGLPLGRVLNPAKA
jgi:SprT protein